VAEGGVAQRTATIFAADAVGYTRLMADDETATIESLDAARAVFIEHIEANQGRVVDTAGDSVLAVFETIAGAVRAAEAIQGRLAGINEPLLDERRMYFRIGIHLGDIHEKADGTVYGDGVNIAARLESIAQPGAIIVSDVVQGALRDRLDVEFADAGMHKVKNVKNPVKAFSVTKAGETASSVPIRRTVRATIALAATILVLVIVGGAWWASRETAPGPMLTASGDPTDDPVLAMPTGPAIAVLPFDNITGDPEQEYFSDGMTEEIITELSRFRDLRVVARNTTFQYKGQAVDVAALGRELGVRYVLEGSVRKAGDTVRISAQLLDADGGGHLWAETFERELTAVNLFEVQDAITETIVATIADQQGVIFRSRLQSVRNQRTDDLGAHNCILRAYDYHNSRNPDLYYPVRDCLQRTIETNPTYPDAWAWLARMYLEEHAYGYSAPDDVVAPPLDRALDYARKATELEPLNQSAHYILARTLYLRHDRGAFLTSADRAVKLNPNHAAVIGDLGALLSYVGDDQRQRGIEWLRKAIALNPRYPPWYNLALFWNDYWNYDYEAALVHAQRIDMPNFFWRYALLAAAYGQLDRQKDARAALERLLELYPNFAEKAREEFAIWIYQESSIDHQLEGLEKAGLFDEPEAPSRPVIAVLPFTNMSGDPEQEYFADGITEDIITGLSRFHAFRTLAPDSIFAYKGIDTDMRDIAHDLGADYVVMGSIRRAPSKIRVIAKLLDAGSATHLWGETYERDLTPENIFAVQDDIASQVIATIGDEWGIISASGKEKSRTKAPGNIASYDCMLRVYQFYRTFHEEDHERVRTCLEVTVERDPDYSDGWAWLANVYNEEHAYELNVRPEPLERSLAAALRATEIDPRNSIAYSALADVYFYRGEKEAFLVAAERALELNPYNSSRVALIGLQTAQFGEWEGGIELVESAMHLNPDHPSWLHIGHTLNNYREGDYEGAVIASENLGLPDWSYAVMLRAAAYAQFGKFDQAHSNVRQLLALDPAFLEHPRDILRRHNLDELFVEHVMDGLRKAGMRIAAEVN
jgi:adenylate cyclase